MEVIARQIVLSSVGPAAVFVAVALALRVVLSSRSRDVVHGAVFAVCFAWGQVRIIGELPWPPIETSHALVVLAFGAVAGRMRRSTRIAVAFLILNVGCYFALYPLVESAPRTVIVQWLIAQLALAAALAIGARMPGPAFSIGVLVATLLLGIVMLDSGSTSLAMTSWLIGAMTVGEGIVSRVRLTSTNDRVVQPVFVILLIMELVNYVR